MKKLVLVLISFILTINILGCSNFQSEEIPKIEFVYESLSKREEYLMSLTGNKVLTYKLKDIPKEIKYEISLTYEVYENDKKIKEDTIISSIRDEIGEKDENRSMGLNIENSKIRYILDFDNGFSSGDYDLKEDLKNYSTSYLTDDVDLELGKDIYIYYATSSNKMSDNIPLGVPIDEEVTKNILNNSNSTLLLRLSFKEI